MQYSEQFEKLIREIVDVRKNLGELPTNSSVKSILNTPSEFSVRFSDGSCVRFDLMRGTVEQLFFRKIEDVHPGDQFCFENYEEFHDFNEDTYYTVDKIENGAIHFKETETTVTIAELNIQFFKEGDGDIENHYE